MAEELFIPKLGQTVEEVTLLKWQVQDGDKVKQGQEVLEVETDKAIFNVEAVDDGYIHFGPFEIGQVVPVLTVVAVIGAQDETFQAAQPAVPAAGGQNAPASSSSGPAAEPQPGRAQPTEKNFASPRARRLASEKGVDLSQVTPTGGSGTRVTESDVLNYLSTEMKVSPVAKRMAAEANLDLRSVQGSGQRGEITREDVAAAIAARAAEKAAPQTPSPATLPSMPVSESIPLAGVRKVIAQRMGLSAQTTARVTLLMEADATELVILREKLKKQYEVKWGFAPGYNELLAKACAIALRRFPYMNARLNGETIERLADVNIGIAVDADQGLVVPVIRDVDQKDLQTVGREFRQYVDEVRANKANPDHISGGTFTITNLGMYDVDGFTPVINLPEAAILGVGRVAPQPVVRENQLVIRKMMTLSMAFDHRLTDGAPAARFLQYIKQLIEEASEVSLTK
ncbi:2-oxo acid dehydrogenase subunit E2 [Pelolinea submarina]|uniref:Dihydrolipoamide acetyltransferase component of pyruvate dehydrogenase complex n=1 Tax=Pelolinea submarina TaxID=913107 RepID=A0A347ZQW4_9CHLR|nr:2-oxo acid dehydrogenase subunit E2 [Pelolinea submarina]REG11750.1 pyruvate dehydrogenase E2 component (dihydrolipoamide acetyltransferase) [Pelolinea submarina]BBB47695.1 pyruvate dehydrogenase E2 component, dihydrolipoamide acetyltransferase [Pelolinea submarina]